MHKFANRFKACFVSKDEPFEDAVFSYKYLWPSLNLVCQLAICEKDREDDIFVIVNLSLYFQVFVPSLN